MESLFESLIGLLPIALIIALRIASSRMKKQAQNDTKAKKEDPAVLLRRKVSELTGMKGDEKSPFFDDPSYTDPRAYQELPPVVRGHWEESMREPAPVPKQPRIQSAPVVPVATISDFKSVRNNSHWADESSVTAPAVAVTPMLSTAAERNDANRASDYVKKEPKASLSTKLSSLHPLKQAVVYAEILGTPKGMQ